MKRTIFYKIYSFYGDFDEIMCIANNYRSHLRYE